MTGKYTIEIYDNRIHYQFEIKRNITIIQGDSATGKTSLIRMISDYERLGKGSGIVIKCEKECVVLPIRDWRGFIERSSGCIIFIDETAAFVETKEFAETINGSDNYFVIINRNSLPQLAYSVEEIYGIREDKKYLGLKKAYNEFYKLYNLDSVDLFEPDLTITEDTNSGYECMSAIFRNCISAGGKSKVGETVTENLEYGKILAIVDGASFGSDMNELMRRIRDMPSRCVVYAPESFEYLVLKSGIIKVDKDILESTYDYADSKEFSSWEQFFTDYLMRATCDDKVYRYSKRSLVPAYLTEGNLTRIKRLIPVFIDTEGYKY